MKNITFAIIKPDAVKNRNTGKIYDRIISAGFEIKSAKLLRMTQSQAEGFYAVHKERPFFGELTEFIDFKKEFNFDNCNQQKNGIKKDSLLV